MHRFSSKKELFFLIYVFQIMSELYLHISNKYPTLFQQIEDLLDSTFQDEISYPSLLSAIVHEVTEDRHLEQWIYHRLSLEMNKCLFDCELSIDDSLMKIKEITYLKAELQSAFQNHYSNKIN